MFSIKGTNRFHCPLAHFMMLLCFWICGRVTRTNWKYRKYLIFIGITSISANGNTPCWCFPCFHITWISYGKTGDDCFYIHTHGPHPPPHPIPWTQPGDEVPTVQSWWIQGRPTGPRPNGPTKAIHWLSPKPIGPISKLTIVLHLTLTSSRFGPTLTGSLSVGWAPVLLNWS